MLFAVFMLLGSTLSPWVPSSRAPACAVWVATAAAEHGASLEDALVVAEWAGRESGCNARAVSADGLDCGLLQLRGWARRGHSCAELQADPVLTASTWLDDLDELRAACGTTRAALGALATGRCGGAPALVSSRCRQSGGGC